MRWPWSRAAVDGERGSITLLAVGFAVLALAVVLVVATASAVHLERKRLLSLADGAAADAATAVDLGRYYTQAGEETRVPVTDTTVEAAVADHLQVAPAAARLAGLAIVEPTGTPDGITAEVSLAAVAHPPFLPWPLMPWSDGIALRVTATARAG